MLELVYQEQVDAQTVRLEFLLDVLDRMLQIALDQQELEQDGMTVPLTLLFASVLKAHQAGRAVQLLSEEGFIEEILAIGRTLVEVTVNGAYLQHASPKEIRRFLEFHPEALHKQLGMIQRKKTLATSLVQKLGTFVLGPRAGAASAQSWSSKSVVDRAQFADQAIGSPLLGTLVQRCYSRGHAAISGTMGSLDNFIGALATMTVPERKDRMGELADALFGVNLCFLTLCVYLNQEFRLGMEEAITGATSAESTTKASLPGL